MVQFLYGKIFLCVHKKLKSEALQKEIPAKDLAFQKQPFPDVFTKKVFLRKFSKLPEKLSEILLKKIP